MSTCEDNTITGGAFSDNVLTLTKADGSFIGVDIPFDIGEYINKNGINVTDDYSIPTFVSYTNFTVNNASGSSEYSGNYVYTESGCNMSQRISVVTGNSVFTTDDNEGLIITSVFRKRSSNVQNANVNITFNESNSIRANIENGTYLLSINRMYWDDGNNTRTEVCLKEGRYNYAQKVQVVVNNGTMTIPTFTFIGTSDNYTYLQYRNSKEREMYLDISYTGLTKVD